VQTSKAGYASSEEDVPVKSPRSYLRVLGYNALTLYFSHVTQSIS